MLQRLKLTTYQALVNPQMRMVIIFGTLIAASLVAGAPSDFGGGGGK
jgi:hypothetical protein